MKGQPILVVDDDKDVRTMLCEVLAAEGYSTIQAANGLEALDRLRTSRPALLFVDLMMPQLDGDGLIRAMKQDPLLSRIPIAIMSGHRTAASPRSVNACLVKPFELDELLNVVHRLADRETDGGDGGDGGHGFTTKARSHGDARRLH